MAKSVRVRQDNQTGAMEHVSGKYQVQFGARHIVVSNALKSSIADAYVAYCGQIDQLPDDLYGLALHGLDRAFSPNRPTREIDFNLQTSPFCTSRQKHAQIHITARRVLKDLDKYVHQVRWCVGGEAVCVHVMWDVHACMTVSHSKGAGGPVSYSLTQSSEPCPACISPCTLYVQSNWGLGFRQSIR